MARAEIESKNRITTWVQEAFRNERFDKITVEFPKCDTSGGYAAEIVYVDVEARKGDEKTRFHVLVKKDKEGEAVMDSSFREIYSKEVFLYSTYFPYLKRFAEKWGTEPFENLPHCYGTVNENNHYVILMENLRPKNFRCHPLGGEAMSLDHAKLVITAYAKWHAFGLAVRDQDPKVLKAFGKPRHLLENNFMLTHITAAIEGELEHVSEIYKAKDDLKMVEILQRLKKDYAGAFRALLENKDEKYSVPRHGDSWNNNFLFHYEDESSVPDQVMVIDWQAGLLGNPLADVNQYLFNCCSRKVLDHLDEILKLYYDTLSKKLRELGSDPKKCLPWEDCKKSFEHYVPLSVASVPLCSRMCYKSKVEKAFDLDDSVKDGHLNGIFGTELSDPEGYFERIDGILQVCVERGLI